MGQKKETAALPMQDDLIEQHTAWQVLATAEGNPVCECPLTGETWQFVGTDELGMVFEHAHHPVTRRHQVIRIKNGRIVCNS